VQVRDLDNRFYEACNTTALLSLEKYGQEGSDLEALPEDARTLLQDKDTLLNAVQVTLFSAVPASGRCIQLACLLWSSMLFIHSVSQSTA